MSGQDGFEAVPANEAQQGGSGSTPRDLDAVYDIPV